jgi:hypothetical protein
MDDATAAGGKMFKACDSTSLLKGERYIDVGQFKKIRERSWLNPTKKVFLEMGAQSSPHTSCQRLSSTNK